MPLKRLKEASEKYKEAEEEYKKVLKETKEELASLGLKLMEEEPGSKLKSYEIRPYTIPTTITWDFPNVVTHIYPYLRYPPYTVSTSTSSNTFNFENKRS